MILFIKNILSDSAFIRRILNRKLIKKGTLKKEEELNLDEANRVLINFKLKEDLFVGLVKDYDKMCEGFVLDRAYWPKFQRFLKNNFIRYEYYDIASSNWQSEAEKFDVIIWHMHSSPVSLMEASPKIYFLEKIMKKVCVPSYNELWSYENKINLNYLYNFFDLPQIPTYVGFQKDEALSFIEKSSLPLVSKLTTGSASLGVEKLNTKKSAENLVNKIFSYRGKKTYWPYLRQKGYVYLQQFIPNADFDLRVIVVGNKLFGYYRFPKKNDFRASGSGKYAKKEIETNALDLAWNVKECFGTKFLATDMLYSQEQNKYLIIESSFFIGVDTCEQLVINGVAGYYEKTKHGYEFKSGKFWMQELLLMEVFKELSIN